MKPCFNCFLLLFTCSLFGGNVEKIDRTFKDLFKTEGIQLSIRKIPGGLTNENYLAQVGSDFYFVRCKCPEENLLGCSLEREWKVTSLVSAFGLTPKNLFYSMDEGIMVSEFIDVHGKKVDLRKETDLRLFCQLVRSLHHMQETLPTEFCPFACIRSYMKNAIDKKAKLPSVFLEMVAPKIEAMRQTLQSTLKRVPCHLDLHSGNLLDDGERIYLIDWEYSAMGDPLFDLAVAASTHFFLDEEMKNLLGIYLERAPSEKEWDFLFQMRILADARWALWCYLQERISPISYSYAECGNDFLKQCLNRLK